VTRETKKPRPKARVNRRSQQALGRRVNRLMERGPDADEWSACPLEVAAPLDGFPVVPLVQAGDGGLWVPIYVYVSKETR
jgi:hypothetical protein